ncbi:unnamed protein product [Toxocara canis]|uniref:Post-GPI attachment to proteins factor 2 n=1 Tax=Toxocara canis TaxID=6265 RepID=A0A183UF22_TOXCA|nr:unnamed protein product [Toxocara canis]
MSVLRRLSDWRKELLPSLSPRTLQTNYLPLCGAVSHTFFTVHIFTPQLLARFWNFHMREVHLCNASALSYFRAFPKCDLAVSNTLLLTSHLGIGFYVYHRPHLNHLPPWTRVEYSVFASLIFNFGSLLLTVLVRTLFPQQ